MVITIDAPLGKFCPFFQTVVTEIPKPSSKLILAGDGGKCINTNSWLSFFVRLHTWIRRRQFPIRLHYYVIRAS